MGIDLGRIIRLTCVLSFCVVKCNGQDQLLERQKRGLAYPINSCTGVLVAIAVPLGLEHQNVFVSYNFEANYNMPTSAADKIPGPLKRLEYLVDPEAEDRSFKNSRNTTDDPAPQNSINTFISRTKIYKLIESKISGLHLNGRKCLLRLICEAAHVKDSLFAHNGVIGDILNILLSPSSTSPEGLTPYHEAESAGFLGQCQPYRKDCNINLLDYFSGYLD